MKRDPFMNEGMGLDGLLGTILGDFADNASAELKEEMIEDCGSTPEVGRFLAKTGLEIDIRPKLTEIAGKLAEEEQKNEVLRGEFDNFRNAVFEQTEQVSKLFGKKKLEMRNLRSDNERLEEANRELCRQRNAVHGGLADIDSRLRGFIADLKGSGEMKKDEIIEFMESLRDRASDAYDEENHRPGSFLDPRNSRYERRMEEKAAAEQVAKTEGQETVGDAVSTTATTEATAKKPTARKSRNPKTAKAASVKA